MVNGEAVEIPFGFWRADENEINWKEGSLRRPTARRLWKFLGRTDPIPQPLLRCLLFHHFHATRRGAACCARCNPGNIHPTSPT